MITRILNKPLQHAKSFFLLGPRGTGKTYWVRTMLPQAIYIDLLDTEIYTRLLAHPNRIIEFIPKQYNDWIIIDEVQRIPALLNEVHRLIEQQHSLFILTGSSARSLRKKGVNLLAGRALTYSMHPLIPEEIGEAFDLKQSLLYGMLPSILTEPAPKAYLKAYVQTYLREEVLQEGLTRNLSAFTRFLEVASFSQGQILNMSSIARETSTSQKTIQLYFGILEDLLLGHTLPAFNKRAKRQTILSPKFYFFDVGIYQTLRPVGFIDSKEEIEGIALESLFLQTLRAINDYYDLDYRLFYWRTLAGLEVDFILHGPQGFYAFEIKRSSNISKKDLKGLKAFQEDYPSVTPYLIYGGERRYVIEEIDVIPIRDALQHLHSLITQEDIAKHK